MAKTTEKLITIVCEKCMNAFVVKANIKIGTEGTETTEIDVTCPHCGELLTTEIEGRIRLDKISLRRFKGKTKK